MKKSSTKTKRFYKMCSRVLLFVFCLTCTETFAARLSNVAELPPRTITGVVRDQTGTTLPGVSVSLKGTTIGTTTDISGKFKLNVPEGNHVIVVSFVGFATQEINIDAKSTLAITLLDDVSKLDEVVVVGYGSQSRVKLTTSITKLDARVLNDVPYTNIGNAFEGNVAGLQVQNLSGQPGAAPRIILRGGTSINNPLGSSPLIIMDGIIRPNALADVNSNDIESAQVLKDAAATAIYGARGSNGVIILTTKHGKPNKTSISYTFNGSAANAERIVQYASAADYINLQRQGYKWGSVYNPALLANLTGATATGTGNNFGKTTGFTTQYLSAANAYKLDQGWSSIPDPLDATKTIIYKETVFQDLIYRTGYTNDHYVSATGGTDKATFYAGLGYTGAQGTAEVTNWKRLSFNLNGSYKITDKVNAYGQLLYSNRTQNTVSSLANVFYRSASLPGTAKYMYEDGTIAPGGQNSSIGNPDYFYKGQYAPQGDNGVEDVAINFGFKWNIAKDLVFEPYVSMLREGAYIYTFQPAAFLNGPQSALVTSRTATQTDNVARQEQGDATLTYTHTFATKHNVEAKVGYSHYFRNQRNFNATGQNAATDLIPTLNGSATPTTVNGTNSSLALDGAFFRVNYDYDAKYLLSVNGRYDGASNLGSQKFGFFPGVSVGWNIDKEQFWHNIDAQDHMQVKLRGSYGVNGNISGLSDFQPQGSFTTSDLYGGQAPVRASVIPNSNLKWEQSKTFDVGTDIGLFDKKVSIIFDYFNRRTDDLLTTVTLPQSTGFANVVTNFGSLQTRGVEAEVSVDVLPKLSKFKWTVTANAGYTKRTILKLPNNGVANNRQGGTFAYDPAVGDYVWLGGLQEGGTIGVITGYKYTGIYQTDADAAKGPVDQTVSSRKKFAGDAMWADLDNNNIIDSKDQVIVGNQFPAWTGGFNNFFTYKQFGLNIRTDFTTGATLLNYPSYIANGQLQGDALPTAALAANVWKKVGDVNATYPRYMYQSLTGNYRTSTVSLENADFFCLRAISLSYALPQQWAQKARMQSARIGISGYNLYYFTGYSGSSPEGGGIDTGGDAGGRYPESRTYTLSLNVTF